MVGIHRCEGIVRNYASAVTEGISVEPYGDGCVVLTPFLRPDGDFIEVVAEPRPDGSVRLTDMGETVAFLHLSGLFLSRRILGDIRRVSHRYGVELAVNELVIGVNSASDMNPLHALLQAALGVAALIEKRRPYARLQFDEEVEAAIIAQGRQYDPNYSVPGEKERHTIRFHINGNLRVLAQPFSQTNEEAARGVLERWHWRFYDILAQDRSWRCYALLDDRGDRQSVWTERARLPLSDLVQLVPWSLRERFLEVLVSNRQYRRDSLSG